MSWRGAQQAHQPDAPKRRDRLKPQRAQVMRETFCALRVIDKGVGMAGVVSLRAVVEELDALTDESTAYLNRATGELCSLRDDEVSAAEDGDHDLIPDWLEGGLPKIREILESEDWLALPTRFDIHEWAIMDGFARSVEDDADLRDELMGSIRGRGAFRCFKDVLYRRGIQDTWYHYRAEAFARIAIEWLDEHGLSYVRDDEAALARGAEPAHQADAQEVEST